MAARSSGLHGAANSKLKVLGEGKAWGPWHHHQAQYRYLQSLGKPCATHLLGCVFWGTFVFLQNSIKLLMALLRQSELQAPLRLTFSIVWPGSGLRRILRNIWSASGVSHIGLPLRIALSCCQDFPQEHCPFLSSLLTFLGLRWLVICSAKPLVTDTSRDSRR